VESAAVIEETGELVQVATPAVPPAPEPVQIAAQEEIWVELPEAAPAEAKPKARRRRSSRAEAAAEVSQELATPVPVAEEAPATPAPAVEEAPVEPVAETPAVVLAVDNPPPPEPAKPDPAEIVAPPVAPKRGWWRRSS